MLFTDRTEAGRRLAARLADLRGQDVLVLGLPRGGVPVAYEIAEALDADLDVVCVRKVGAPRQPELALGAVVDGGRPEVLLDERLVRDLGVSDAEVREVVARETATLARREALYRGTRAPCPVAGRSVVVVDDGIATGATMLAALGAVRRAGPRRLVAAVPVSPPETLSRLRAAADEVVCLAAPRGFLAVGQHYLDFTPVEDATVLDLLARRAGRGRGPG